MSPGSSHQAAFPDSTCLAGASYDEVLRLLVLRFVSGGSYSYPNIPMKIWDGLIAASSKGRYYNEEIRRLYGRS